jgi:hypothetical protein
VDGLFRIHPMFVRVLKFISNSPGSGGLSDARPGTAVRHATRITHETGIWKARNAVFE